MQKPIKQNWARAKNLDQTCFNYHIFTVYTCIIIHVHEYVIIIMNVIIWT